MHLLWEIFAKPNSIFRKTKCNTLNSVSQLSSFHQPVNVHLASPKESCPEVMTHVTDGKKRKLQLSWIAPVGHAKDGSVLAGIDW